MKSVYDSLMTNVQALINFTPGAIDEHVDALSARLDAAGFPVVNANLEDGTVIVDASADPDEYSVLMAASLALEGVELSEDILQNAVIA